MTHLVRVGIAYHYESPTLLHGVRHTMAQAVIVLVMDHQTIHDNLDIVIAVSVQFHSLKQFLYLTVYTGIQIALASDGFEQLGIMSLAAMYKRSQNIYTTVLVMRKQQVNNLLLGISDHTLTRLVRKSLAGSCVKQTQEIIYLGRCAYGRTWILVRCLLFDTDNR